MSQPSRILVSVPKGLLLSQDGHLIETDKTTKVKREGLSDGMMLKHEPVTGVSTFG